MTFAADAAAGALSASVRILPPRPRRRDWAAAGLCAGLLLGLAEWALLWAAGLPLPPRLAFFLFVATALLVAIPATLSGVILQRVGVSLSHSAVVGALVGPLLVAPVLGTFVASVARSESAGTAGWAITAAGLLAIVGAAVAGALAGRTFDRLEDGGLAMSGPVVFGLAAALLAIGEAVSAGDAGARSLLPAALLLLGVAVLATVAVRITARRGSVPWPWGRTLALLLGVAAVAPFAPRALPWLLYQGYDRPAQVGPASVLLGLRRVEKTEVFSPRNVDEDFEPAFSGQIEEPAWRDVIEAEDIGPELANLLQITGGLLRGREHFTLGIRGEGAVGDSLDVELAGPEAEELPVYAHPVCTLHCDGHAITGSASAATWTRATSLPNDPGLGRGAAPSAVAAHSSR